MSELLYLRPEKRPVLQHLSHGLDDPTRTFRLEVFGGGDFNNIVFKARVLSKRIRRIVDQVVLIYMINDPKVSRHYMTIVLLNGTQFSIPIEKDRANLVSFLRRHGSVLKF